MKNKIIVAIDLMNYKCVRLIQGNFRKKKIYYDDPMDIALLLEDNGITRIHLVDLDGARIGKIIHWKILEKIAKNTNLIIDFGGGINTKEDIKYVFESGAHIATVGSIAVKNPLLLKEWINFYGKDKILLGVDVKNESIAIDGWKNLFKISLLDFLVEKKNHGIENIFCTDIFRDGVMEGPSFLLYKKIIKEFTDIKLIASGGVRNINDVEKLLKLGCYGVIIGKAMYEKKISFNEIINCNKKNINN
ncbi:1-(5-phosphoribosyl)-5-[(5-phosphoribosylamino)methylideneamino]imidazole-4-carboxamide isomerase [Blattabacterium cuenoti]|uniref:1-(5-phosphoribosyl)-5-[(5- phosphoribosylamino)methylideneamino]imidazole-4- carboxamide isomerase n=1 Tax=Blattabacterium cuenoti TaxID=1653831 RepID=UPI00163C3FD6|nr:1-(5-phosphoribosyl)-5-[(5-phosphoribosylamino)methylideneamino]imidazole-4-carboxamide isomerase [Blattabacterium cuenoti]